MPRRVLAGFLKCVAAVVVLWTLGFVWFVMALPGPAPDSARTDGIAVLTGGAGRTAKGHQMLEAGRARRMLVSGVDQMVKPEEWRIVNDVPVDLLACCIDLGFAANNTRSNATEVAEWVAEHGFTSIRLVTTGYHMPRARAEIRARVGPNVAIVADAVPGRRTLAQMALEYSKFLAARTMLMMYPVPRPV